MTDVVLVRHGETVWHGENRYAGRSDIDLSDEGRLQAGRLGRWSATAGLSACFTSPLRRARETLAPVCETTGLPARTDDRLRELDFGEGEGLTADEMKQLFGNRRKAFTRDPVRHHLPGGEDPARTVERAAAALDELCGEFPRSRVLVVSHSTVIRLLLCQLLGVDLADYRRVFPRLDNVGLTEVRVVDGGCALLRFNGDPRCR